MSRCTTPLLTSMMLVLAVGSAMPAAAQQRTDSTTHAAGTVTPVDYRSSKWLSDRKVVNDNGEEIAAVSDMILDRGSGRIEYLILKTGETFGLGGRAIAVPYGSGRWDSASKERFLLSSTAEQLKQYPEFTTESWKAMKSSTSDDKAALRQRLATSSSSVLDPYEGSFESAQKVRVEGEITAVERVRTTSFGEQIVITVLGTDGTSRRVALGPSWFVNASPAAPMRGQRVVIDAAALPRDPEQMVAAYELRDNDRKIMLRSSDGRPSWAMESIESGGQTYSAPYSRYLLLSDLNGRKIDCRGEECGRVHEIIMDRNSGEIGFISVDPNENFLGIADTKRLVPWSVATVRLDGVVRIDASKEMVIASPETPGDLSTLNTGNHAERAYSAFNVPAPHFNSPGRVSSGGMHSDDSWSARGPVLSGIESNTSTRVTGTVSEITEVSLKGDIRPAHAVRIKRTDSTGGDELVLMGPAWYMQNQKPMCKVGDTVTMDAVRTNIAGQRYWLARSVECKDTRVVLLDGTNSPAWKRP